MTWVHCLGDGNAGCRGGAGWAEVGGMGGRIFVVANRLTPWSTPFTDPRLASARGQGSSACRPILPSVQMILVGGVSMLHDPGYGPGGGVEVLGGWVAVSLIRAPIDFCLSNTQPPPGPHLDTCHWTAMDPSGPANSGFPGF